MSLAVYCALLAITVSLPVVKLLRGAKAVDYLPGPRCPFAPMSIFGAMLPTSSWNPGLNWSWLWRSFLYKKYGSETIAVVPFLSGRPTVCTCSIEVAKQVLSGDSRYIKAPESTVALLLWGDNVISSNGEVYKRHRRIVGPAFTSGIFAFVWEETLKTYQEMLAGEGWLGKTTVSVSSFNRYASKLALIIICRCGFGLPFPWVDSTSSADEPSFDESLATVSQNVLLRLIAPRFLYAFPIKKLTEVEYAYKTLGKFMASFVSSKRAQIAEECLQDDSEDPEYKADLFTRLVSANGAESKLVLDDQELIGNIFSFMFAGHETTAHVISATLGLLAIYPDEQEAAWEQIHNVLVNNRDPTYSDTSELYKVMACFQEAARMFPAGSIVTRNTVEPVKITAPTHEGDRTIVLPAGVMIVMDMIGIHYNPRYFEDPETFKPSRWYGAQDSDLTFFGLGPRACLGKKFAITEALCFLTVLLRDWHISPILKSGETTAQWRARVLQGNLIGLAFGVRSVPVKLIRRA